MEKNTKIGQKKWYANIWFIILVIVLVFVGVVICLSSFGMQSARQASRDAKRKADLELIRSGIEIYKADCNTYPTSLGPALSGNGLTSSCPKSTSYIDQVPTDPLSPARTYAYTSNGSAYTLCASLEQAPTPVIDITNCGSCISTCNYKEINP